MQPRLGIRRIEPYSLLAVLDGFGAFADGVENAAEHAHGTEVGRIGRHRLPGKSNGTGTIAGAQLHVGSMNQLAGLMWRALGPRRGLLRESLDVRCVAQ